ncbi:MAG: hypothetical protein HY070_12390, partial [Chloroflexi bacterium]|nr:hypothetical protein [Chloroflexota bacterium]
SFYLEFLRARKKGLFDQFSTAAELHECESCGQPTTAPGRCAFCRMWNIGGDAILRADEIPVAAEINA